MILGLGKESHLCRIYDDTYDEFTWNYVWDLKGGETKKIKGLLNTPDEWTEIWLCDKKIFYHLKPGAN